LYFVSLIGFPEKVGDGIELGLAEFKNPLVEVLKVVDEHSERGFNPTINLSFLVAAVEV